MTPLRLFAFTAALAAASSPAYADDEEWSGGLDDDRKAKPKVEVNTMSSDLIETRGFTRFQVLSNSTFTDGQSAFSSNFASALELRADVAITDNVSLGGVVPVGIATGGGSTGFLGNIALGVGLGFGLQDVPMFRMGFGLDVGLPTSSNPDDPLVAVGRGLVASLHAYDVHLFVPALTSFRLRGHGRLDLKPLILEVDIGAVPGFTIGDNSTFVFLMAGKARAAARFSIVEPFFEIGGAAQVAGNGRIRPPLLFGPGLRLHIKDTFRPALSVMFNAVEANAVMFGLDLAITSIPSTSSDRDSFERRDDDFDF